MKSRYLENSRKRIVFVIVGIVVSYLGVVPLGILYHQFSSASLPDPISSYFFFNSVRIGIMVLFLYLALVYVKPSFVPQQRKYQKLVIFSILAIAIMFVAFPSGYVVPQLEQGACITKSGSYDEKGRFGGSSSQGITTESECIENCIFSGKFNTREEKFCEFEGIFGKTHWKTNPDEIATDYKPVFKEMVK